MKEKYLAGSQKKDSSVKAINKGFFSIFQKLQRDRVMKNYTRRLSWGCEGLVRKIMWRKPEKNKGKEKMNGDGYWVEIQSRKNKGMEDSY